MRGIGAALAAVGVAHAIGRIIAGHEHIEEARLLAVREDGQPRLRGDAIVGGVDDGRVGKVEEELDVGQPCLPRERLQIREHRPKVIRRVLCRRPEGEVNPAVLDQDRRERVRHPRVPLAAVGGGIVDRVDHLGFLDAQATVDPRREVGVQVAQQQVVLRTRVDAPLVVGQVGRATEWQRRLNYSDSNGGRWRWRRRRRRRDRKRRRRRAIHSSDSARCARGDA